MPTPVPSPCPPTAPGPGDRPALSAGDLSRIIEMAWEDRTPFEDIEREYGLPEPEVIALMRRTMKPSSFRMWRKRMAGRLTKHRALQAGRRLQHTQRTGGMAVQPLLDGDGSHDAWGDACPSGMPVNLAQGPSAPSLRG